MCMDPSFPNTSAPVVIDSAPVQALRQFDNGPGLSVAGDSIMRQHWVMVHIQAARSGKAM
jgi:hypothetical protein